jgi:hypothetical protein
MDKRLLAAGGIVASLICLGFAIYGIRKGVVFALRGRGGHNVPVYRDRDPLLFWVNVWFYIGLSATILYWAFSSAA